MTPRGTPKWVRQAHIADQIPNFLANQRSAAMRPRLPPPVRLKALSMPLEQCFGPNDRNGINDCGTKPIPPNKRNPIKIRQARSLWRFTPKDVELLTKNQDLDFKPCSRLKQRCQNAANQDHKTDHETEASTDSAHLASPDWVCGRDRCRSIPLQFRQPGDANSDPQAVTRLRAPSPWRAIAFRTTRVRPPRC
jgi:hypothetical protein